MGDLPLRQALASYLGAARVVRCEAEQIMIVGGSQQALEIAARVLIDPGQPVWVEEPGYGGARDAFALAGARLVPVPVDEEGLDVAAGIARCPGARGCATSRPPTSTRSASTMTASRRLQLLDWARSAPAPGSSRTTTTASTATTASPSPRCRGSTATRASSTSAPSARSCFPRCASATSSCRPTSSDRFAAVREAMDIFPPALHQAVLADFIGEGHFARHLRRTSLLYRERRRVLAESLGALGPRWRIAGAEAGIHLVAIGDRPDRPIALRAAREGLWTMPLSSCYLGPAARRGLVLGYGGVDAAQIPAAVARLAKLVGAA